MPEVLSQQEIDSLLSGIPIDTVDLGVSQEGKQEKEVINFDFRLPHRLSKNQLRTMQAIHENFAESLSSYMLARLQTSVGVTVTAVDQLFYSEYVLSIPSPSCLYIFRIVESDATAIIEFSPQLAIALVPRLLGGISEPGQKPRLITRIEQNIVRGIAQRTLADLQKAWKIIADLSFKLDRYESEGDFAQIAPTSEIVLLVSFEVTFGDQKFLMNICFPTFALEGVFAKLNIQYFSGMQGLKADSEWSRALLKKLRQTTVPVTGLLGTTTLTLRELMALQVGDVLRTNIPMESESDVIIGGRTRFRGRPGISKNRMSVKVTKFAGEFAQEEGS
ncbi:MAG: flagellar motor switch protein FliM [Ignavibacteriales bacterium]|nr:flagellar motor switch protein FliM [Ignavibacteriales bacterium]